MRHKRRAKAVRAQLLHAAAEKNTFEQGVVREEIILYCRPYWKIRFY
jgi:hypothetical protein